MKLSEFGGKDEWILNYLCQNQVNSFNEAPNDTPTREGTWHYMQRCDSCTKYRQEAKPATSWCILAKISLFAPSVCHDLFFTFVWWEERWRVLKMHTFSLQFRVFIAIDRKVLCSWNSCCAHAFHAISTHPYCETCCVSFLLLLDHTVK